MKIREVSEQQINAALSDLERKIDSKDSLKQVNSDWNSTTGVSQILNKPKLAAVATSGDYNDLTNKPHIPGGSIVNSVNGMTGTVELHASDVGALPDSTVIPAAQVNSDWNATSGVSEILNKPSLATVATSGDYNDLTNTPTIPTIPVDSVNGKTGVVVLDATDVSALPDNTHIPDDPVQADWNETDNTKLDYIKNKPTIPTLQDIFDVTHPVGEVYVQFPQQDAPTTLYNQNGITSTWVELDYGGKFFRANGGNAKPFVEKTDTLSSGFQGCQNKYHNHGVTDPGHGHGITQSNHSHTYTCDANVSGSWGSLSGQSASGTGGGAYASTQGAKANISIDSATTGISIKYNGSSSDQEARPDNYTIKIWKRTA